MNTAAADAARPLLATGDDRATRPVAWHRGRPVAADAFVADVTRVAAALPAGHGHLLNLCADRYHFAVGFCAAALAGRISLLPPNHSVELVARLRARYDDLAALTDTDTPAPADTPVVRYPAEADGHDPGDAHASIPTVATDAIVAYVFTSGSTGQPTAHRKTWGRLIDNVRGEAKRLGLCAGDDVTLVGTVPPQHMYGFESTVLLALHNRLAFSGDSPFYPADIAATLTAIPGQRVLVTTPFHLRTLLAARLPLPAVRLLVCATAPLAPALAREAEDRFGAPLVEIYGCTEAGQLATRRPVEGEVWQTFDGLRIDQRRDADGAPVWLAEGGHIEQPTPLSDVLALESPTRFRLLGRGADMINVAGKRASLAHLNRLLVELPDIEDGAFHVPEPAAADAVTRLVAFYVSATLDERTVLAQLRQRTDAVFLPRPLYRVDRLPRSASGKLPQAALADLAARLAAERAAARAAGTTRDTTRDTTPGTTPDTTPDTTASQRAAADAALEFTVPADHPAFDGHFPGQPILPGVVILAWVMAAVERHAGRPLDAARLRSAKFHATVTPGMRLAIELAGSAPVRFDVRAGATRIASGSIDAEPAP